jgi:hypothetical protein
MRLFSFLVFVAFSSTALAQGTNYVGGHYRKDGTYVQPHYRTNPDSNVHNNWTTRGNVNPYTGQAGTVDPYASSNGYSTYGRKSRSNSWGQ